MKKKLQRSTETPVSAKLELADDRIDNFDDILAIIGSKGPYQKWLLYGMIGPTVALIPLIGFSAIFIHGELDHWCYQDGIEHYNETELSSWKNSTLPIQKGPDGNERFSQCQMYNITKHAENETAVFPVIDCPSGWSYNRTELVSTIVSEFDWVCSKNNYVTLVYTITSIGGLLGNFVLGPLADKFGRRPIYFIGTFIFFFFGFISLFTPGNYILYVAINFLSGTGASGELLSLILSELTDDEFRSWACSFGAAIWVVGMCATPCIAYLAKDWFIIGLATYIPCSLLLLYVFVCPESPRWLISVGRVQEAAKIIKKIAAVNGTSEFIEDDKLEEALQELAIKANNQSNKGEASESSAMPTYWTLLTKLNVLKITILLTIESVGSGMIYSGITLNTANLAGNQFVNFFILGLIEFPSSFLAGYLLRKAGRRWTQSFSYFLSSLACFVAAMAVGTQEFNSIVTIAAVVTKFTINATFIGLSLQQAELYPTPFRSTGMSCIAVVAGLISLLTPSMVYLGKYYASGPHIAMGGLALLASIAASFLPETLNQSLPETIEQSNEYGKHDKFWALKPRKKTRCIKYGSLRRVSQLT